MPKSISHLIERSSFGAPTARRLASRTSNTQARRALVRAGVVHGDVRDFPDPAAHTHRSSTTRAPEPGEGEPPMADKKTSANAASAASKVLRDGRTSKSSKTAAGSALSQRGGTKRGK